MECHIKKIELSEMYPKHSNLTNTPMMKSFIRKDLNHCPYSLSLMELSQLVYLKQLWKTPKTKLSTTKLIALRRGQASAKDNL